MKLLTILPTRSRPGRIVEALESFKATASVGNDLIICMDDCDPMRGDYKLDGYSVDVNPRGALDTIFNDAVKRHPEYDYYFSWNDDMIFRTVGWDKILVNEIEQKGNGWGVSFGDDMIHSGRIMRPTYNMISKKVINVMGYLLPPGFGLCGDWYLGDLCAGAECLFYRPDVIIEHKHVLVQKAELDETYRSTFEGKNKITEQVRQDAAYRLYRERQLPYDIEKLRKAMGKT
jgi:hypothetical protein